MNARLASRLGRPDLTGVPVDPYSGTSGGFQAMAGASGSPAGLSVGGTLDGRVTAGVLLLMLAGVVGFYWWTRGIQA